MSISYRPPEGETALTIAQLADEIQRRRGGRKPSYHTIWRWWRSGRHGIKLERYLMFGESCTTVEALERFEEAVNCAQPEVRRELAKRCAELGRRKPSAADASKAHSAAKRRLKKALA